MNWYKKANNPYGFYEGQELTLTKDYFNYSRIYPERNKIDVVKVNEDGTLVLKDKSGRIMSNFRPTPKR